MRAFFITAPGQSTIGEVAIPKPGPDEVLLRTRLVGLCGSDLNTFRGKNPMVTYPRILGHEIAATIEEAGGCSRALAPRPGCHCVAIHELRPMRLVPSIAAQRVSVEPDFGSPTRRSDDIVLCDTVA